MVATAAAVFGVARPPEQSAPVGHRNLKRVSSVRILPPLLAANMAAPLAGSSLRPHRSAVAAAAEAACAARMHLHRRYLKEQPGALQEAGGHSQGDFAVQAWLHAMLRSADEVRGQAAAQLVAAAVGCVRQPCSCPRLPSEAAHLPAYLLGEPYLPACILCTPDLPTTHHLQYHPANCSVHLPVYLRSWWWRRASCCSSRPKTATCWQAGCGPGAGTAHRRPERAAHCDGMMRSALARTMLL